MILRRVIEHVRAQNWTAVALDFVIVVLGVFIGILVSNWNAARQTLAEEAVLVERIRVDFERIGEDAERSLAYHKGTAEDLATLVRALRSGVLQDGDREAVSRALFMGIAFQTSADHSGTFTELLSSGRANILRDKELLNDLVAYEDFLDRFAVAQTYFVDMAIAVIGPFTAAFQYQVDAPFITDDLQLNLDGASIAEYDFDAMVADPAFHNAVEQLVFVHNLYAMWRQRITRRIAAIEEKLSDRLP